MNSPTPLLLYSSSTSKRYPPSRILKFLVAGASILSLGVAGCKPNEEAQAHSSKSLPAQSAIASSRPSTDAEALVKLGPRVAGTPVMEKASNYLLGEYRRAGYVAEIQTFSYPKFEDSGSHLIIDGKKIEGRALNGSLAGKLTAPLVLVPNVGRKADFASVDVKGAVAIVQRGEIRFIEKAQNAASAGAVGLVIVNNKPNNLSGALGGEAKIPVLGLGGERGSSLLKSQQRLSANLVVNTSTRTVTGRNIVARLPGVTKPSLVVGAHYDSVTDSPGANDNASGTAVVLAIARNLAKTPIARQAWFVAFDGEEDGLHGSRAFVSKAGSVFLKDLKGMLNFDMVGVNNQLLLGGTKSLTQLAKTSEPKISTFGGSGGSDHAPFANAGVPVLFFYRGQEPNYHTPNDKQIDPKLLDETVRVGINVMQAMNN